jgi:hypothetical protein
MGHIAGGEFLAPFYFVQAGVIHENTRHHGRMNIVRIRKYLDVFVNVAGLDVTIVAAAICQRRDGAQPNG